MYRKVSEVDDIRVLLLQKLYEESYLLRIKSSLVIYLFFTFHKNELVFELTYQFEPS